MKSIAVFALILVSCLNSTLFAMNGSRTSKHEIDEEYVSKSKGYAAVQGANDKQVFDPYAHAIELSKMRLNYVSHARDFLVSEFITPEDKLIFCKQVDPDSYSQWTRLKTMSDEELSKVVQDMNLSKWLVTSSEDVIIQSTMKWLDFSYLQWKFLHQSLVNLSGTEDKSRGVKQLIKESMWGADFADRAYNGLASDFFLAEAYYTRSIIDVLTFYLHCKEKCLLVNLERASLFLSRGLNTTLHADPSMTSCAWFVDSIPNPGIRQKFSDAIASVETSGGLGDVYKIALNVFYSLPNVSITVAGMPYVVEKIARDVKLNEFINNCHLGRLFNTLMEESDDFKPRKKAMRYFLTPKLQGFSSYKDYEKSLLNDSELKQKMNTVIQADIDQLDRTVRLISERKRKHSEEMVKDIESIRATFLPQVNGKSSKNKKKQSHSKQSKSKVCSDPSEPVDSFVLPHRAERDKPTSKKEKTTKEIQRRAELEGPKVEDDFVIVFEDDHFPSNEEIELYHQLWLPEKERADVTNRRFFDRLTSFGWQMIDRDVGRFILIPPAWLDKVRIESKTTQPICRFGFMFNHTFNPIHMPLNGLPPLPDVPLTSIQVDFLRMAFRRALGLSENVIKSISSFVTPKFEFIIPPEWEIK